MASSVSRITSTTTIPDLIDMTFDVKFNSIPSLSAGKVGEVVLNSLREKGITNSIIRSLTLKQINRFYDILMYYPPPKFGSYLDDSELQVENQVKYYLSQLIRSFSSNTSSRRGRSPSPSPSPFPLPDHWVTNSPSASLHYGGFSQQEKPMLSQSPPRSPSRINGSSHRYPTHQIHQQYQKAKIISDIVDEFEEDINDIDQAIAVLMKHNNKINVDALIRIRSKLYSQKIRIETLS